MFSETAAKYNQPVLKNLVIVASNDLDEEVIDSIKNEGVVVILNEVLLRAESKNGIVHPLNLLCSI